MSNKLKATLKQLFCRHKRVCLAVAEDFVCDEKIVSERCVRCDKHIKETVINNEWLWRHFGGGKDDG